MPILGNIVPGVFTPVLAKHTKSFDLVDTLSVEVDRIPSERRTDAAPNQAMASDPDH